jgi:nucleoside-diphosphate-sugar epimerase
LVPALGAVRAHLGAADIEFTPDDETVAIVESWPRVLSGAAAAADWGWQPRFLLDDAASDFVGRVRQIGDGAVRGDGRPEVAESR